MDQREFVGAQTRREVSDTQRVCEAAGVDLQRLVADLVTAKIVDLAEPVEIDRDQRYRVAGGDRLGQVLVETGAVRQSGEIVVERHAAQPLVGFGRYAILDQ